MKRFSALILLLALLLAGCGGKTVLESEEIKLSNVEFSYYYWTEVRYYMSLDDNDQLTGLEVDMSLPLDEQMYDETTTWQDHMIDTVLEMIKETKALAAAARAEGFEMPESYTEEYDEIVVNFIDSAMSLEYKSTDHYLRDLYGKGADLESFEAYLSDTHLAAAYADMLRDTSEPTQEQLESFYAENADYYGEDGLEIARDDLRQDLYNNAFLEAISPYAFTVYRENIRITVPEGLYE